MAQWQWHYSREKVWHSDSDTSLEKKVGTVTVTLYSRNILAQWQWHCSWESWHIDSDTSLEKMFGTVTMTLYSRNILAHWHFTRETYWHRDTLREKHFGTVKVTLLEKHTGTVTVTFYSRNILAQWQWLYSRNILAQWQWHFTWETHWHSDSDTLLEKHTGTVTLYARNILAQWQWLYSRHILAQWQWHFTRVKYWHSGWHCTREKRWNSDDVWSKITALWVTMTRETYWHSDSDTLLNKILAQWVILHSRASINFRPHFPVRLIDSGDLRYSGSPRETIHELCVLWKSMPRKAHLTWRRKQNFTPFSTLLVRFVQNSVHEMCTKIY